MVQELSPKRSSIASSYSIFGLAIGASLSHQVAENLNGNNHLLPSLSKKKGTITASLMAQQLNLHEQFNLPKFFSSRVR
jgi:hypothetical protein